MPEQLNSDVLAYRDTFGKYLLSLAWFEQSYNGDVPIDGVRGCFASGFVMSFSGTWCWVTAGHVLKDLLSCLKEQRARIWQTAFIAVSPTNDDQSDSISFSYPDHFRNIKFEEDFGRGVDVGVMRLSDEIRDALEKIGVAALSTDGMTGQEPVTFDNGCILGTPVSTRKLIEHPIDSGVGHEARASIVVVPVISTPTPENALPTPRRFFRVTSTTTPEFLNGLSGAPIFGLKHVNNETMCRLIAIQSQCHADSITIGCQSEVFIPIVRDWIVG